MARYPLNLPVVLKEDAERYAAEQGVSLNQFILWAVSEKIGSLSQRLDDPQFPQITYRRSAYGPVAMLRGTNLRVQAIVVAVTTWGMTPAEVAVEYGLQPTQVDAALQFYKEHSSEVDAAIAAEVELERQANSQRSHRG
jgi:uncharacterized protein (DUF433 family)